MTPSQQAEMAVLGSMLVSERAQLVCFGALKPDHFELPSHRRIFEAMRTLREHRTSIDWLTVESAMKPEQVGEYLHQCIETIPTPANAADYAAIVCESSRLRALRAGVNKAYEEEDDQALEGHLRPLLDATRLQGGEMVQNACAWHIDGKARGFPSGWGEINRLLTTGGYPAGQIWVTAATTKGGKSWWMLREALALAKTGAGVLYATFADLDTEGLNRRLLKMETGFYNEPQNAGDAEAWHEARERIGGLVLQVYDATTHRRGRDLGFFVDHVEAHMATDQFADIKYLFVDYLQKIYHGERDSWTGTQKVTDAIKRVAEERGIAAIVASQLSIDQQTGLPTTKGGRGAEEDAAVTSYIQWEHEVEDAKGRISQVYKYEQPDDQTTGVRACRLNVKPNRFGPGFKLPMEFDVRRCLFHEPGALL